MAAADDIRVRLSSEGIADVVKGLRLVRAESEILQRKTTEATAGIVIHQRAIANTAAIAKKESEALTKGEIKNQEQIQFALNRTAVSRLRLKALTDAQAAGQIVSPAAIKGVDAATASTLTLGRSLSGIKSLLGTLGIVATGAALVALAKSAANFADEMGKAGQRTGSSSENFSVLAFAASTADVELGELELSLGRLVTKISELKKGLPDAVDSFDRLGLSAADFAGKDTAQAFDVIALKISKLGSTAEKVELAKAIFGRGGAVLVPLLNDLGTKGFDHVREKAAALGLVIGGDLTKASQDANDSLKLIGQQVKGLAVQFVSGLAKSVTDSMTTIQDETTGKGAESMKSFGGIVGKIVILVIGGLRALSIAIEATFGGIGRSIGAGIGSLTSLLSGEFSEAVNIIKLRFKDMGEGSVDTFKEIQDELGKTLFDLLKEPPAIPVSIKPPDDADVDEVVDSVQKQIDDRLEKISKKVGTDEFANLQKIADKRQSIAEEEIKNQQAIGEARAAAIGGTGGEAAANAAAEAALRARVALVQQAHNTEIQLAQAKAAALIAAVNKSASSEETKIKLRTEITKRSDADQLASAQGYYSKLLALNTEWLNRHKQASDAIRTLNKQRSDDLTNLANFNKTIDQAGLTEAQKLGAKKRELLELESAQMKAIQKGDIEGSKKIFDEAKAAAEELAKLGDPKLAKEFFEEFTTRNTAFIDKQIQAQQTIKDTATKNLESITVQFEAIKTKIAEFESSGLSNVAVKLKLDQPEFDTLINSIKEQLATKTFPINVTAQLAGGGAITRASGGPIPGVSPHPRADDKLIWATSGEYVLPVRSVQHYGTDFLEQLRSVKFPRMAEGGVVGGGGSSGQVMSVDFSFNRRPIGRVSGERETINGLLDALAEVERGTK